MSLSDIRHYARSLEVIENYALTAEPFQSTSEHLVYKPPYYPYDDLNLNHLWYHVLDNPDRCWGRRVHFNRCVLSEWVARVPGLIHSMQITTDPLGPIDPFTYEKAEYESDYWQFVSPEHESLYVYKGIGSLKFPPDHDGYRLFSLCASTNVDYGVPTVFSPEKWEDYKLLHRGDIFREGNVLTGYGYWQKMSIEWSERFPTTRGIPRGYLLITEVDEWEDRNVPTKIHPCTVMEYSQGDALLYDYVFATADTGFIGYRQKLQDFFHKYKNENERYGRYLLAADINDPLWDAEYTSPEELRRTEPGAKSQLALLEERVREHCFNGNTLDQLVQALTHNFSNEDLQEISRDIRIPLAHWFTGSAAAHSAVQLLDLCVQRKKVEELVEVMVRKNETLFGVPPFLTVMEEKNRRNWNIPYHGY